MLTYQQWCIISFYGVMWDVKVSSLFQLFPLVSQLPSHVVDCGREGSLVIREGAWESVLSDAIPVSAAAHCEASNKYFPLLVSPIYR